MLVSHGDVAAIEKLHSYLEISLDFRFLLSVHVYFKHKGNVSPSR